MDTPTESPLSEEDYRDGNNAAPRPDRELGQANVDENRFSYPIPPLARFTLRNPESPRAEALKWFDTSRPQSGQK